LNHLVINEIKICENIVILKSEVARVGCVGPPGLRPVKELDPGNFRFLPQEFSLYILCIYTHMQTCVRMYIERELFHE
jgi:hypothetical protein